MIWLGSAVVGVALVEIFLRMVKLFGLTSRFRSLAVLQKTLRSATTDDERQAAVMTLGMQSLVLGILNLALVGILGGLAWLGASVFCQNDAEILTYGVALSCVAAVWGYVRATARLKF